MNFEMIVKFLKQESTGGIILFIAALLAILLCNSPFVDWYQEVWDVPWTIRIASVSLTKPLMFWINEGLMTLFFLLIGLELKREFLKGELSQVSQVIFPGVAAIGGMLVPILIYCAMNALPGGLLHGWAIPAATDIAFALGVLSLFGQRVPLGLKLFLMALAIFDDLGAIIIITLFYANSLSYLWLGLAILTFIVLQVMNRKGVQHLLPYLCMGVVLWICTLKSGIHATVAGVLLAWTIPLNVDQAQELSPLCRLEESLHVWVAFLVMPLFAFANAGVSLSGLSFETLLDPVVLGVVFGLFLGKQLGVFSFSWLMVKLKWVNLPENTSWLALYAVAVLCGIGFTMSLFLGTLAFQGSDLSDLMVKVRLGVLLGSLLSGTIGALILQMAFQRTAK